VPLAKVEEEAALVVKSELIGDLFDRQVQTS